jgi:hypothetical protein
MATILLRGNVTGGSVDVPPDAVPMPREPLFSLGGFNALGAATAFANSELAIRTGDGITPVIPLISRRRQLELFGVQAITAGIANAKTFPLETLRITGGVDGNVLTTDGTGTLRWAPAGSAGRPTLGAAAFPKRRRGRSISITPAQAP